MTWTFSWFQGLLAAILCMHVSSSPLRGTTPSHDKRDAIVAAIDSLRGISLEGMDRAALEALNKRMDGAWETLLGEKALACGIVREVLQAEAKDSVLILDLSRFSLQCDSRDSALAEIAGFLQKADPDAWHQGFFELAARMSARRCLPCVPAILRILEVDDLDAYVAAHSLPVDTALGMVFTLGQYGEDVVDPIRLALKSPDCVVRRNAAFILGDLLPSRDLPEVPALIEDTCAGARAGAWPLGARRAVAGGDRKAVRRA